MIWQWATSFVRRHPYMSVLEALKGGIIIGMVIGYFLWG